jgi:DnaJ-class molecular chaperone
VLLHRHGGVVSFVCKHLSLAGLCPQCILEELLRIQDDDCISCDGMGTVVQDYEPIPGVDHQMGESVRVEETCRTCRGSGKAAQS